MSWVIDIDARRITGLSDGADVTPIDLTDRLENIVFAAYAGLNDPTYNQAANAVTFDPTNSEALVCEAVPSSVNSVLQSEEFFYACRATVNTFGTIHYTTAFGNDSNGSPVASLRYGTNDPTNFVRSGSGVQASPVSLSNVMDTTGQMYTVYLRGDGTNIYFGVDDPLSEGGTREVVLTGDDFAGSSFNVFAIGALVRSSADVSGSVPVDVQGVYLWDGSVDATTRDTLLSDIASGIVSGPQVSITDPLIPGITTTIATEGNESPWTGARITDASGNVKEITLVSQTSVSAPALGTQDYCQFGTVTLEVYNATESATTSATFNPPAAYEYLVTLPATPSNLTNTGYLFNWSPDNGYEGVQVIAPFEIDANGNIVLAPSDGVYTLYSIDDFDGEMQGFTVTIQDGVPVSAGKLTRRNLTRRTFTRRSLTSRP